ncbi:MAG: hypothetical protein E6G62_10680 [Actinobacteria bacterium]|nr:MAG: hypothetical protein E6G62_10680 [Actinomycetota bacterium]
MFPMPMLDRPSSADCTLPAPVAGALYAIVPVFTPPNPRVYEPPAAPLTDSCCTSFTAARALATVGTSWLTFVAASVPWKAIEYTAPPTDDACATETLPERPVSASSAASTLFSPVAGAFQLIGAVVNTVDEPFGVKLSVYVPPVARTVIVWISFVPPAPFVDVFTPRAVPPSAMVLIPTDEAASCAISVSTAGSFVTETVKFAPVTLPSLIAPRSCVVSVTVMSPTSVPPRPPWNSIW